MPAQKRRHHRFTSLKGDVGKLRARHALDLLEHEVGRGAYADRADPELLRVLLRIVDQLGKGLPGGVGFDRDLLRKNVVKSEGLDVLEGIVVDDSRIDDARVDKGRGARIEERVAVLLRADRVVRAEHGRRPRFVDRDDPYVEAFFHLVGEHPGRDIACGAGHVGDDERDRMIGITGERRIRRGRDAEGRKREDDSERRQNSFHEAIPPFNELSSSCRTVTIARDDPGRVPVLGDTKAGRGSRPLPPRL